MSTLTIENVFSDYQGQVILNGLNLTLQQGEIVALLGPSGCGKTTLLRAIAGLQPISQGTIKINGDALSSDNVFIPSEQRGVGMIFQDYALFPHLTVADNILFGVKGLNKIERQARLDEMLELVKLAGLSQRYPHELSGGQQQRVSIARALAYQPQLLLLDEPFSNIDAQVRNEMMLEIRNILKQRNVSAVFVTHSKDEAFVFADKLALFKEGSIIQHGLAEELYAHPNDRYVAEFLGAGNYLPVTVNSCMEVSSPIGVLQSSASINYPVDYQGQLLLRPQQVELVADEQGLAVIVERRFLGTVCHYWVKVEEHCLEVRSQLLQLSPGQKVNLFAPAHPLVIF
ncbi:MULTISPECIES: ABC transporter ATP-binding protein [Shewanella]|jgi:iron(III) transport system ATP-binding protein|uniref:ABC transporter ATP-binding protein n=1 Tax=Shewanella holmiensis TaxID=2952222 RepID=A0A9X2WNZ6_9GAMM|nr:MULTISPECIES: ABC transporter ATP-binding protein [Shewanella]MCT7942728.1 ABC transporter ATP-binding protein [Shewanella holmiensis]MDP5146847.1 ABC transporter ATP-binding protein [Shewanella sp. ULN5]